MSIWATDALGIVIPFGAGTARIPQTNSTRGPGRLGPPFAYGSRLGRIGVEIDFGDALNLTVDTEVMTVRDVLNAIVRQASPRAWIVITTTDSSPTVRQFGFMHRWGSATYITIPP